MFRISTLARFALVIGFILNAPAVAQEAFLKKGTVAINPDDIPTLFLYVPGYTLLYDLEKESKPIGRKMPEGREEYQLAKTQDGIRVLVRTADIRKNVEVLRNYHFLVNRRMPLCDKMNDCNNIWSQFSTVSDEGENWIAMWARVAGKFEAFSNNEKLCAVPDGDPLEVLVSIGASEEEGFIPRTQDQLRLDDSGFITLLNCRHPAYIFRERMSESLTSPCTQERSRRTIGSLWRGIENHRRGSVYAELRAFLAFLGLGARVEEFTQLSQGRNDENIEEISVYYGKKDEEWQVKFVDILRRPDDNSEGLLPFAKATVRKVFQCDSGQSTEMKFASFLVEPFPMNDGQPSTGFNDRLPPINLDAERIRELGLPNNRLDGGLVSINKQSQHYKLLDFFLGKDVPKSIANFFIKEINVASPRR